jgi:hypothetical protein
MSRIRSIHPGLWTDERFVTASPMARLFFMGLWNECDDYGSFEWSPLKLKMRLLPADNADASALLEELSEAGSIIRYEVAGKSYGAVRNFCQFQRPKKPNSVYPQTDEIRNWVNTEARSTRDGSEAVENELPTGGEIGRQMEDGGDKGKRRGREPSPPESQISPKPSLREQIPNDISDGRTALNYVCAEAGWRPASDTQRQSSISIIDGWLAAGCSLDLILSSIRQARKSDPSPTRSLKRFDSTIRGKRCDQLGGEMPITMADVRLLTSSLAKGLMA